MIGSNNSNSNNNNHHRNRAKKHLNNKIKELKTMIQHPQKVMTEMQIKARAILISYLQEQLEQSSTN
jgi:hypothetical protein